MHFSIRTIVEKAAQTKYKLMISFGFVLALSVLIVLTANRGTQKAVKDYQKFTNAYQLLSDFYRNIESAESYAKSYMFDRLTVQLEEYNDAIQKAEESLKQLGGTLEEESLDSEYRKLNNMVITYNEVFMDMIAGSSHITDSYGFFNRLPGNIQATYIQYTEVITKEMKTTSEQIDLRMKKQAALTRFTIVLMVCGVVGGMILSTYSISGPIQKLVHNVEKIKQGSYQTDRIKSSDPQIRMLSEAIAKMAEGIEENIAFMEERATLERKLLTQENENLKINKILVETELKVLQGQMNPHFLFNTLNLISKMAYLEQAPKTSKLMQKTSDLLRYSLEKSISAASLFGEIQSVKNYLEIQKLRMGHRITFQLQLEDNLPDILMQGMIIQPIIENAVVHGVNDMVNGAKVIISVKKEQDTIVIQVEDNGKGISSDKLEQILSGRIEPGRDYNQTSSIGIQNVSKRLEMFYGTDGILSIESSENCGTVVTIKIPIREEVRHVSADDRGR